MARLFPGGAATDKISSALSSNTRLRTYLIWSYRTGDGGGGSGRMFNKGTTGTTEYLTNVASTNSYDYSRFWTGGASWRAPRPSANAWHPILVRYDSNSSSNVPEIFIDGVSQSLTPNSSPSGSPQDNAEVFVLGQRASDDAREWEGRLAEFAVWDRLILDEEVAALTQGLSPWHIPLGLVEYIPLVSDTVSYKLPAPTVVGTTVADHPPVYLFGSISRPQFLME